MTERFPRLLLAAPASGSGKTTATCAILRALVLEGVAAASFKCGPDYIDPMFHRACVGVRRAGNLDLFFSTPQQVRRLLAQGAAGAQIAVLEGVMGLYDGIACTEDASAYQLARPKPPSCWWWTPGGWPSRSAPRSKGCGSFGRMPRWREYS